jgi:hypothetical protein
VENELATLDLDQFRAKASQLTTLIPRLDALGKPSEKQSAPETEVEVNLPDMEHLGRGPKIMDPSPEHIYPSSQL